MCLCLLHSVCAVFIREGRGLVQAHFNKGNLYRQLAEFQRAIARYTRSFGFVAHWLLSVCPFTTNCTSCQWRSSVLPTLEQACSPPFWNDTSMCIPQ
jgi:hypothetical protein